ncbi:hypothetical protein BKA82DRAFT_4019094 [Pisolithus tinctorius]|nr:hypothetical protein BKA82DRAFT_4019094 [Pisolithus tinctorius]
MTPAIAPAFSLRSRIRSFLRMDAQPQETRTRIKLVSLAGLRRVQFSPGIAHSRLNMEDNYFEQMLKPKIAMVEMVAGSKQKNPSRVSAYGTAKSNVVSKLAESRHKFLSNLWNGMSTQSTDIIHISLLVVNRSYRLRRQSFSRAVRNASHPRMLYPQSVSRQENDKVEVNDNIHPQELVKISQAYSGTDHDEYEAWYYHILWARFHKKGFADPPPE